MVADLLGDLTRDLTRDILAHLPGNLRTQNTMVSTEI
jgi:hypothetical protein